MSVYLLEPLKSQRHEVTLKRKITYCTSLWINVCGGRDCAQSQGVFKSPLNCFLYRSEFMSGVRKLCSVSHSISDLYVTAAFSTEDLRILHYLLYLNKFLNWNNAWTIEEEKIPPAERCSLKTSYFWWEVRTSAAMFECPKHVFMT